MAVGNTSEAKPPIQVAGGSLGWQVAGVSAQRETGDQMIGWGRDARTSHPFESGAGSRRVLEK